jgi:hypothetical protein
MSSSINFASTPTVGAANLTTGDISKTAPTTVATIFSAAAGGQIERIVINPLGATTATVIRIFRYDGTTYHLYTEISIPNNASISTSANKTYTLEAVNNPNLFPILIPTGWSLRATVNSTQIGINIQAEGGAY